MYRFFNQAILALALWGVMAQADTFVVDQSQSTISFKAKKFLFVGVKGTFNDFRGEMEIENNAVKRIWGEVVVASVNTENEERDGHLKGAGYFNGADFPTITFSATAIKATSLLARISIKGIEKDIPFNIDSLYMTPDSVKLIISTIINRTDFDLEGEKSSVIKDGISVKGVLVAHRE